MRTKVRIQSTSAIFVWRALRNFAMADFEENVAEMVGKTRETADGDRIRWRRDSDETGDETGCPEMRPATTRRRRLVTNETAATGG